MNQTDLIVAYGWYREQMNAITRRIDAIPEELAQDSAVSALEAAKVELRNAFLAEIFPTYHGYYPAVFFSASEPEEK